MASYWKTKVVPKIKKYFDKGKNKTASDANKYFEKSKPSIEKELAEKNDELKPKVLEVYKSSSEEAQKLLKEPAETGVTENPEAVQYVLQELAKTGFPGAQQVFDAGKKHGTHNLPGPIVFVLAKASIFIIAEDGPPTESRDVVVQTEAVEIESECPEVTSESIEEKTEPEAEPAAAIAEEVQKTEAEGEKIEKTERVEEKAAAT